MVSKKGKKEYLQYKKMREPTKQEMEEILQKVWWVYYYSKGYGNVSHFKFYNKS